MKGTRSRWARLLLAAAGSLGCGTISVASGAAGASEGARGGTGASWLTELEALGAPLLEDGWLTALQMHTGWLLDAGLAAMPGPLRDLGSVAALPLTAGGWPCMGLVTAIGCLSAIGVVSLVLLMHAPRGVR